MAHLNGGSMTTGRPLPRPLPPITDSFIPSTTELKFGIQRGHYTSNSYLINDSHGNREVNAGSHLNNLNFATAPRNLNINSHRYEYKNKLFTQNLNTFIWYWGKFIYLFLTSDVFNIVK